MDIEAFNKNTIKNKTLINKNIDFCWDYTAPWYDGLLDQVFHYFRGEKILTHKIAQGCSNKNCVNPKHLVEVTKEIWDRNYLEMSQRWMDFV
jgi:hypothetical protein